MPLAGLRRDVWQVLVATLVRSIFAPPSAAEVRAQLDRVVAHLAGAAHDLLAFATFSCAHWRQT